MLHTILDDDHIQWHPPLIRHYTNLWPLLICTLLPNLTFHLIVQGIHRTYATGAACQQRKLTPPDTWSCPTLGFAFVLTSRPISPELILFPDYIISNIPRSFSFASRLYTDLMTVPGLTFTELRGFHWACVTVVTCQQGVLTLSDTWFRQPFLGLAWTPIVKTRFLDFAVSLLDFSPWIFLGTVSILLQMFQIDCKKVQFFKNLHC